MSATTFQHDDPGALPALGSSARPAVLMLGTLGRFALSVWAALLVLVLVPMLWGWEPTVVESGSMSPVIRTGDVVIISPHDGQGLGPGTVVQFHSGDGRGLVTHRIVAVTPEGEYRTRGDANRKMDSTPLSPGDVVGVGRVLIPYAGLPAYWARSGHWAALAAFAAVMAASVWLAGHLPARRRSRRGRWLAIAGVALLVSGGAATPALGSFSGTTPSEGNILAAGWWRGVADVAAGREHSCAALVDGSVWCWGRNNSGQLGDGTVTDRRTATRVVGPGGSGFLADAAAVTAGEYHTCAVLGDGSAWCWGSNSQGQLGDGSTTTRRWPVQVRGVGGSGALGGVIQVEAGGSHTCARTGPDPAVCWGLNSSGQLGDGTTTRRLWPVPVSGAAGVTVVDVGVGPLHSCAVLGDGSAWCWGAGGSHRLGNGSTSNQTAPQQVAGPGGSGFLGGVVLIEGGGQHSCAVLGDGSAWCWGRNNRGQLGIGSSTSQAYPSRVLGVGGSGFLTGVARVEPGAEHSCARLYGGAVACWGRGNQGQLGIGNNGQRTSPVQVVGPGGSGTFDGAFDLVAGWYHNCSPRDTDEDWCWGRNRYGQLGDGTTSNRNSPVQVEGL
jgi:signal peptidase I